MTKAIKPGYITEKQAAKILGKSQKILQNYRYNPTMSGQKLPFIKHERRILYKRSDVIRYKEILVTEAPFKTNPNYFPMPDTNPFFTIPLSKARGEDQLDELKLWKQGIVNNIEDDFDALQKKIIEMNERKLKKEKFESYYRWFMIGIASISLIYWSIYRIFWT